MQEDNLTILKELLEEGIKDKKKIDCKIQKNISRIQEIESFLDSLKNSEDSDFKVFSPRSAESIHREEIQRLTEKKNNLNNRNDSYYLELGKAESRIEKISSLIKESKDTDEMLHFAILDVQEKERSRIARELHDSSLQNLTHLIHNIELASLFIDQDPVRAKLELASCSQNLKHIINEIRDTVFNLRPMAFDDLGFKQCIENLIDNMKQQYKSHEFIYDIDDITIDDIEENKKKTFSLILVTVYRVIQEALTNSAKHSQGNKLELSVKKDSNRLLIIIADNGKGFSVENIENTKDEKSGNKHFGISIMQERIYLLGGKFEINSKPEQGTRIFIIVPLL